MSERDIDRYREMKETAKSLWRAAETLEEEAISVKHNSDPENGEYLASVLDKAVENIQSLDIETNRSAEGQR